MHNKLYFLLLFPLSVFCINPAQQLFELKAKKIPTKDVDAFIKKHEKDYGTKIDLLKEARKIATKDIHGEVAKELTEEIEELKKGIHYGFFILAGAGALVCLKFGVDYAEYFRENFPKIFPYADL